MPRKSGSQEEFPTYQSDSGGSPLRRGCPIGRPTGSFSYNIGVLLRLASGRDIQRQRRELDARQRSIESEASAR
jgi:hypothetical protein